ncbi:MAG: hypothetical protein SFW08_04405 [Gemmatimonadaceae bacterium]|nr:hypothetical protein [Gemmatimonadaceae bacterium]
MTTFPRLAVVLTMSGALAATAEAQSAARQDPPVTFGVSAGPASLTRFGRDQPQQRPGTQLTGAAGFRLRPRLTLRLDGSVASVRTSDIIRSVALSPLLDNTAAPATSMVGANVALEAQPFSSSPLRLRAGPTYLHAEAPLAIGPTAQPPLDSLSRTSAFGWRIGAALPLGGSSSPVWLSGDVMRANSRRGGMWFVPIGLELRFR